MKQPRLFSCKRTECVVSLVVGRDHLHLVEPFDALSTDLQLAYEDEGTAADLIGRTRADCPYDRKINPAAWFHWVYSNEDRQRWHQWTEWQRIVNWEAVESRLRNEPASNCPYKAGTAGEYVWLEAYEAVAAE